jgi:flavin-binding protein dodecin
MERQDDREWYSGESPESFAAAARIAVEKAEAVIDGDKLPEEYDVRLQVIAEGPLSGYRVLVSPTG